LQQILFYDTICTQHIDGKTTKYTIYSDEGDTIVS